MESLTEMRTYLTLSEMELRTDRQHPGQGWPVSDAEFEALELYPDFI